MEIWKGIPNFETYYEVSQIGNFRSKKRFVERGSHTFERKEMQLKKHLNATGYPLVRLIVDKRIVRLMVHRLIAICFIDNPNNYPCVNHIDGNKENFNISNLEWCTHQHNMEHASKTGLMIGRPVKPISQFSKDGILLNKFNSITEASSSIGIIGAQSNIVKCAKGNIQTAYSYKWSY